MQRWRQILILSGSLTILIIVLLGIGFYRLGEEISLRLETREFLAPTTYWALPTSFQVPSLWPREEIEDLFQRRRYVPASDVNDLREGSYLVRDCAEPPFDDSSLGTCWYFRIPDTLHPELKEIRHQAFALSEAGEITHAFIRRRDSESWESVKEVRLEPQRVAQFVGGRPLLQEYVPLGEIPTSCLNAVLAIEDPKFLDHAGINWKGLARAVVVNILSARFAQGGSTITQQMVKNFFLNSEKTISRKLKELGMALMLESKLSKDKIFEVYLNIIYLGQSGPFQIHGYSAAARHYFQKPLSDLQLPECALLAAVLNYPGGYDPFRHPDRALKRRNLVLSKMRENEMISEEELSAATTAVLPVNRKPSVADSAPYFLEAVQRDLGLSGQSLEGVHVFTTLELRDQEIAHKTLLEHLNHLEKTHPALKENADKGLRLEGIVLTVELSTGRISAAVGGRGFRTSPFNRILDGRRQVGSLAKPFVFLTAFENDHSLTPLSTIMDEKVDYKIYRQRWTPENYTKKYYGEVSLAYALKNSLNAATAALGMKVGLGPIIENLRLSGVESRIDEVPSITLGAMDLKPIEIAEAYLTLARMGSHVEPRFWESLVTADGKAIFPPENSPEQVLSAESSSLVIGMMKEALNSGTGQAVGRSGFAWPAAGKTGTTSDYRDAWFVGFTPWDMTLIWVGYDQNQNHGLTGGSGSLPVWTPVMNWVSRHRPKTDFKWPEGISVQETVTPPDDKVVLLPLRR